MRSGSPIPAATAPWTPERIRAAVVGIDRKVPLLDGSERTYVNLDNAATTPVLRPVLDAVNDFLPWYSSVHRGTGHKSRLSTDIYEEARRTAAEFVGADPDRHVAVFVKHTTEAVNLAARRLAFRPGSVILTSLLEHHANDLPWRSCLCTDVAPVRVEHVPVTEEGEYDVAGLERLLAAHRGRVALVAVSGASNVTGYLPPLSRISHLCHEAGALVFADCAQLAPHRRVDMRPPDDPERLDFVAFSGHKMYAPFGIGVLVGPRAVFEPGTPMLVGGGCVKVVSVERVVWEDPPEKDEAGSPNVVGAVALARAIRLLQEIGWETIAEHERSLVQRLMEGVARIPNAALYSRAIGPEEDRMAVVPFNLRGMDDFLLAAILGYEAGIGVRAGCFCAHPYVKFLLRVSPEEIARFEDQVIQGSRANLPGAVRASLGMYNAAEEIDYFLEQLDRVSRGGQTGRYVQDPKTGMYHPEGLGESARGARSEFP